MAPSLITTQWLLTCFVQSALPLAALLRVWDCLFFEMRVGTLFCRSALRCNGALLILSVRSILLFSVLLILIFLSV